MSADNGIYILKTHDGYRVTHAHAIENLYWWHNCCDNPRVEEIQDDSIFCEDICRNCGTKNPSAEERIDICPERLKEYFGNCEITFSLEEALVKATFIYQEIMDDDYGIVEYGINIIEYDGDFPKRCAQNTVRIV